MVDPRTTTHHDQEALDWVSESHKQIGAGLCIHTLRALLRQQVRLWVFPVWADDGKVAECGAAHLWSEGSGAN